MYLYFGTPTLDKIVTPSVEILLSNYEPPDRARDIFHHKSVLEYQAAYTRVDASVYQTSTYSLSTQTGRRTQFCYTDATNSGRKVVVGHGTQEHDIQIVYGDSKNSHQGTKLHTYDIDFNADNFNHHWVNAVQHKNKALIRYNFDPKGTYAREIYSEASLGLFDTQPNSAGAFRDVQINGAIWLGEDRALKLTDGADYCDL